MTNLIIIYFVKVDIDSVVVVISSMSKKIGKFCKVTIII